MAELVKFVLLAATSAQTRQRERVVTCPWEEFIHESAERSTALSCSTSVRDEFPRITTCLHFR